MHKEADPFTSRQPIIMRPALELPPPVTLPYEGCIAETGDNFTFVGTVWFGQVCQFHDDILNRSVGQKLSNLA